MSSSVSFYMFRSLFRLTLLTCKADLNQDETRPKPFCSICPWPSSHCCALQLLCQHAAQAGDFLCSSYYACMGALSRGALFLFMVWLLVVQIGSRWIFYDDWLLCNLFVADSCCSHLFHSCRPSSRGKLLHCWSSFGKRGQQLQHMHSSWTTSVSCLLKFIAPIVVCTPKATGFDVLVLDSFIDLQILLKCARAGSTLCSATPWS